MTEQLDPWIEGYLSYLLEVRRLKAGSVRDIRCALKKAATFMAEHAPGKALWQLELQNYLSWINHERGRGQSQFSTSKDVSHIRGLLDYSWRSGRCNRNVLDGFRLQDVNKHAAPKPRVLSLDEARGLINVCSVHSFVDRRDRMIVLILYGCGLRTAELCSLNVQDVDLERQEIVVLKGKNDRQRRVPVPAAVWTELLAYLAERGGKTGPLFKTTAKRKRLSNGYVSTIVRGVARRAGLPGRVTPKALRHTFGTHLADRGVDIGVISTLMGHRSPKETSTYLHVLEGRKEEAVCRLAVEGGRS